MGVCSANANQRGDKMMDQKIYRIDNWAVIQSLQNASYIAPEQSRISLSGVVKDHPRWDGQKGRATFLNQEVG